MTKVKLLRDGESLGLVLPPDLVARLALHDGDELSLVETPDGLTLQKQSPREAAVARAIDHVLAQHAHTLELLAKR